MNRIPGSAENWENGTLGADSEYAKPSGVNQEEIDKALELQMISIRLQKSLIEDFKLIAQHYGIGYQPLMKQVLKRFATAELKNIARSVISVDIEREVVEKIEDSAHDAKRA